MAKLVTDESMTDETSPVVLLSSATLKCAAGSPVLSSTEGELLAMVLADMDHGNYVICST